MGSIVGAPFGPIGRRSRGRDAVYSASREVLFHPAARGGGSGEEEARGAVRRYGGPSSGEEEREAAMEEGSREVARGDALETRSTRTQAPE